MRKVTALSILILSVVLGSAHGSPACAQDFLYYDGSNLQTMHNVDPKTLEIQEWRIWLYLRGQATDGPDHWGTTTGSSMASVEAQLKTSQEFEVQYGKFFHLPDDYEKFTYFNPSMAIAVAKKATSTPAQVIKALANFNDLRSKVVQLLKLRNGLDKPYEPYQFTGESPLYNPYRGFGNSVREYAKSLQNAVEVTHRTSIHLTQWTDSMMTSLTEHLSAFERAGGEDWRDDIDGLVQDDAALRAAYEALSKLNPPKIDDPEPFSMTEKWNNELWVCSFRGHTLSVHKEAGDEISDDTVPLGQLVVDASAKVELVSGVRTTVEFPDAVLNDDGSNHFHLPPPVYNHVRLGPDYYTIVLNCSSIHPDCVNHHDHGPDANKASITLRFDTASHANAFLAKLQELMGN